MSTFRVQLLVLYNQFQVVVVNNYTKTLYRVRVG